MARCRLRRDVCIGHLDPQFALLGLDPSTHEPGGEGIEFFGHGSSRQARDVSWGYSKVPLSRERAGGSTRAARAALFEAVPDGLSQCLALLGRQGLDQIFGNRDAEVDQPMAPAGVFGNG
jgi:hypothetical protein